MAAIFQMTFSDLFSKIKMNDIRLKFHWSLFLRFQLTIFQPRDSSIGSINDLAPTSWQAIIWTNDGCFTNAYMHHSASMS